MNNRLKLYDDLIYTYLSHNDKIKLRNLAFKNKMTVSEFNRCLIQLAIKISELETTKTKLKCKEIEIDKLGGIFY